MEVELFWTGRKYFFKILTKFSPLLIGSGGTDFWCRYYFILVCMMFKTEWKREIEIKRLNGSTWVNICFSIYPLHVSVSRCPFFCSFSPLYNLAAGDNLWCYFCCEYAEKMCLCVWCFFIRHAHSKHTRIPYTKYPETQLHQVFISISSVLL